MINYLVTLEKKNSILFSGDEMNEVGDVAETTK